MKLMSASFNRRCFVSFLGSLGTLSATGGALAADNASSKVIMGTRFPDTFVPAGGPVVTQDLTGATHYESGLDAIQNAESHPLLGEGRSSFPGISVEKISTEPRK
jgi:hypothetical protein